MSIITGVTANDFMSHLSDHSQGTAGPYLGARGPWLKSPGSLQSDELGKQNKGSTDLPQRSFWRRRYRTQSNVIRKTTMTAAFRLRIFNEIFWGQWYTLRYPMFTHVGKFLPQLYLTYLPQTKVFKRFISDIVVSS